MAILNDYIVVDLINREVIPKIEVVQGDTARGVKIKTGIKNASSAKAYVSKADRQKVFNNATIDTNGLVTVDFTQQMLAVVGTSQLQLEILFGAARVSTFAIDIEVCVSLIDESAIESTSEFGALETALAKADEAVEIAEGAVADVEEAIQNANAATQAANTATANANAATQAANTAANNADGKASAAEMAADNARDAATTAMVAAENADIATEQANTATQAANEAAAAISGVTTTSLILSSHARGSVTLYRFGRIVIMIMDATGVEGLVKHTTYDVATIPQGYRPTQQIRPSASGGYESDWTVQYDIYPDGRFTMYPFRAGVNGGRPIRGSVCWITNEPLPQ